MPTPARFHSLDWPKQFVSGNCHKVSVDSGENRDPIDKNAAWLGNRAAFKCSANSNSMWYKVQHERKARRFLTVKGKCSFIMHGQNCQEGAAWPSVSVVMFDAMDSDIQASAVADDNQRCKTEGTVKVGQGPYSEPFSIPSGASSLQKKHCGYEVARVMASSNRPEFF